MNAPITLKTLPQATAQEVFDQVSRHLLTQMEKARTLEPSDDEEGYIARCTYRSPEGLKCAAGCLISDDEYYSLVVPEDQATSGWGALVANDIAPDIHADLIGDLQFLHDMYRPESWRLALNETAQRHGLEFKQ